MSDANITRAEAQRRAALLSTDGYRIHVDLSGLDQSGDPLGDPETSFVTTSTISFTGREEGRTHLDVIADAILDATLDGDPLPTDDFTGTRLPLPVTPGAHELTVTALHRYSREGTGLHRFVDPADDRVYLYTQFEVPDARRVYACFEQPDLKARFTISVTAPAHWAVISNAAAVEPLPLEGHTDAAGAPLARWDFAATEPLSTYVTAIVAGEYHVASTTHTAAAGEIGMRLLCRRSLADHLDADRIWATTQGGFAVFEEHFGIAYPFGSYDQAFVPEYNIGAMENAGCVTFRDEYLFRSRVTANALRARDNTILHELAHMWFGDLVTMTWWDDLWLNESFAEWASHFAQGEIDGDPAAAWGEFCASRKTWAYRQDQLPSTHPVAADMVDLDAVELNFDGITYAKGASVLRQLVAYVGREEFLAGVRAYFVEHQFGNTELGDLLGALETSSGRDLSDWSAQWLEVAGVNTMRAELTVDHDDVITAAAVLQSAPADHPTLRDHRIAIGVYARSGEGADRTLERVHRIEVDVTGERTEVPDLVGVGRGDLVLLNDDDLTYTKIRFDERSAATLVDHIGALASPLARAVCWGAAWDSCRDAELAPQDYVAMVLAGVAGETDLTAVNALLRQGSTAAALFSAPGTVRAATRARWESGLAGLLKSAEPGSDHQLAFARSLAHAITGDDGAALVRGWLAGEEVPPGLEVDTDLRWLLVTELARLDAIDDAAIAAELERDDTITGREAAGSARAARPTAAAKQQAWQVMTAEAGVPNESYRKICRTFVQVGQGELLLGYVEPYLATAAAISSSEGVWAERGLPLQNAFLSTAFPDTVDDLSALIERVAAWLADTELTEQVRRPVAERLDDVRRAVRCQRHSAAQAG